MLVFYKSIIYCFVLTVYLVTWINLFIDSNSLSFGFSMCILMPPLRLVYILFLFLALLHWQDFQENVKWKWQGGYSYLLTYHYLKKKFSSISWGMMFALNFLWRYSLSYEKKSFYFYFAKRNLLFCFNHEWLWLFLFTFFLHLLKWLHAFSLISVGVVNYSGWSLRDKSTFLV